MRFTFCIDADGDRRQLYALGIDNQVILGTVLVAIRRIQKQAPQLFSDAHGGAGRAQIRRTDKKAHGSGLELIIGQAISLFVSPSRVHLYRVPRAASANP